MASACREHVSEKDYPEKNLEVKPMSTGPKLARYPKAFLPKYRPK
jgi:hypothetical protein